MNISQRKRQFALRLSAGMKTKLARISRRYDVPEAVLMDYLANDPTLVQSLTRALTRLHKHAKKIQACHDTCGEDRELPQLFHTREQAEESDDPYFSQTNWDFP